MNKKLLVFSLFLTLMTIHSSAYALALSKISLNSSLNQPLDATIEFASASTVELDSLHTSVSSLTGQISGVYHWPHLKVELIRSEQGPSYLKITSRDVVREPIIQFLLELDWVNGQIKREYSLLINPQ
ncbi:MAG: hypothetical protein HY356_00410 [Gammaproteobacteria bacterium]|nr:hypothetical protein [Gammaproteobacteria bacterium]